MKLTDLWKDFYRHSCSEVRGPIRLRRRSFVQNSSSSSDKVRSLLPNRDHRGNARVFLQRRNSYERVRKSKLTAQLHRQPRRSAPASSASKAGRALRGARRLRGPGRAGDVEVDEGRFLGPSLDEACTDARLPSRGPIFSRGDSDWMPSLYSSSTAWTNEFAVAFPAATNAP